jgi:hypothetical protein
MMMGVAAGEAERAAGAAVAENAAIRAAFAALAPRYDAALGGRLGSAAGEADANLDVPVLDAANAALRRLLIELHEAVETAGDAAANRAIADLYVRMSELRHMPLPGG